MVDSLWAFPCPFCHGLCDVRCMWDARLGSLAAVRSMDTSTLGFAFNMVSAAESGRLAGTGAR